MKPWRIIDTVFVSTVMELVLRQMGTDFPLSLSLNSGISVRAETGESDLLVATLPRTAYHCLHTGCTRHSREQ